jgi:SAM-dependent methyltransferase
MRPPSNADIQQFLLTHPDVMDAACVDEEGVDGHKFPVAYVVPHPERLAAAKSRIYLKERDRRVDQWRKTFDQTYRRGDENNAPTFVGWTSNFTNKPIPESEMREWLDSTVQRIASLEPRRILEVGCGVGLLLDRLAPASLAYCGTDLSPIAVSRLRKFVANQDRLQHVELLEREATDFDGLAQQSVDMVVLNSVLQYFPSSDYLRDVLEKASRAVAAGGHIFVGDVRHLGLLPIFHGAVQLAKAAPQASSRWLKRRIALALEQERELVIDPRFFLGLSKSIPRITGAEVLAKRGSDNELTRYRYDVVLHVGDAEPFTSPQTLEWQANEATAEELLARFRAQDVPAVRFLDMPNSRISADLAAVRSLRNVDDRELVGDIRQRLESVNAGNDPEAFWKLADTFDYDVRVGCSPHSAEGRLDVALVDRKRSLGKPSLQRATSSLSNQPLSVVATDPLAAAFSQHLGLELANIVSAKFPELAASPAVIALSKAAFDEMVGVAELVPPIASNGVAWTDRSHLIDG